MRQPLAELPFGNAAAYAERALEKAAEKHAGE